MPWLAGFGVRAVCRVRTGSRVYDYYHHPLACFLGGGYQPASPLKLCRLSSCKMPGTICLIGKTPTPLSAEVVWRRIRRWEKFKSPMMTKDFPVTTAMMVIPSSKKQSQSSEVSLPSLFLPSFSFCLPYSLPPHLPKRHYHHELFKTATTPLGALRRTNKCSPS